MPAESAKQMEISPRILLPHSVKYQSHFAGSTAKGSQWGGQGPGSPRTGPQPRLWTVDNFIKPFIDAKYFLLVPPSHLRSQCLFSAVHTFPTGHLLPSKRVSKPSVLNCAALLPAPHSAPLTIRFQMTSGIRDTTGAFHDCRVSGGTAQPARPQDMSHPRNSGPHFSLLPEGHLHLPLQRFLRVWPCGQGQKLGSG